MEITLQEVMFYYYLLIGISIQLAVLIIYPVYRISKNRACRVGWSILIVNLVWSLFVYYDIWFVFNNPDEWSFNTPGFVLAGYALFGPLMIWFMHALIVLIYVLGAWVHSKLKFNQ